MDDKNEVNKLYFELLGRVPEAAKRLIDLSVDITNLVVDAMGDKGLNMKQLAEVTGKTPSTISNWLSGSHNYKLSDIIILEIALGIKIIGVTNG